MTEFLAKHETKVIAQPPYSPDLAPCDFFLFPKLKYPFLLAQKAPILKAIIKICIKIHKNVVFFNQSGYILREVGN